MPCVILIARGSCDLTACGGWKIDILKEDFKWLMWLYPPSNIQFFMVYNITIVSTKYLAYPPTAHIIFMVYNRTIVNKVNLAPDSCLPCYFYLAV